MKLRRQKNTEDFMSVTNTEVTVHNNKITGITDDIIRWENMSNDPFKFDKVRLIHDVLSVLTNIPVDTSAVLWSLKIKNHKYDNYYIEDLLPLIGDVRCSSKVNVEWSNEEGCYLWSRKEKN